MLPDGQRVVGALLAFYSERLVAGRVEQFCNCLSPSDRVWAITSQFEFRWLDTSAALIPNLPWPERSQCTATY
jgi:hypothetical protein